MKQGTPRLEDLGHDDAGVAIDLLREGFPSVSRNVWERGFARLAATPPPGYPGRIGRLLTTGGEPAGLSLEIACNRDDVCGTRPTVNLSSWYVRPRARGSALWMLRAMSARKDVTYTDLSATTGVGRMLPAIGYRAISHQVLCLPTALHARGDRGRARVLDAARTLEVMRDDPIHLALRDHCALGCFVNALEIDGVVQPLVWRPRRRLGWVRSVELVYARSVDQVISNFAVLSRALLSRGFLLAEVGALEDAVIDVRCLPYFRRRFAKGPYPAKGLDYLYSEFVYFGFGR